jgi:regulatory protein
LAERPKPTANALAIRWLARRDLSRAELAQRLRRRGVEQAEVERVLDDLAALGYLSDTRYATAVVAQRKGRYGKRAIVHALRERGIAAQDATAALAQLAGSDEADDALALWQRRFGVPPRDERDKARQVRFLQARGYPLSIALAVLRRAGVTDADDTF